MGGSWGTAQELDVIRRGGIHYKRATVHGQSVELIDDTAIPLTEALNARSALIQ